MAIDDAGTVAWRRQAGDRWEIVLSDGVTERVALFSEFSFSYGQVQYEVSALTNSGLLAVTAAPGTGGSTSVGTSDVTNGIADEDYDPAFGTPRRADGWDANEFAQVAAQVTGLSEGLVIDGEALPIEVIGPFDLVLNGNGSLQTNNGQFVNDAGQLAFGARGLADLDGNGGDEIYNLVIRADPIGATPEHPILPVSEAGPVTTLSYEIVNALGLTRPIFVDPDPAARFDYVLDAGPLVTSLVIPDQDLGAEDGMFDILFGSFSEQIAFGETLDFRNFAGFGAGVSVFSIAGIDAGSAVTTDDPFVVGLTHAGLGNVDMTITGRSATPAPIPLPAGGWLLLSGLAVLVARRRPAGRASA